jgi:hypothetical protein
MIGNDDGVMIAKKGGKVSEGEEHCEPSKNHKTE